jgi:diguanylate cyclase (GGDEF)-like protein
LNHLGTAWRRFWKPPQESLLQSGGAGEISIARTRLAFAVAFLSLAVWGYLLDSTSLAARVYLAAGLTALPIAVLVYIIVRQVVYRWWIGYVTSVLDVTMVTTALAAFLFAGSPHAAVNSLVLYPIYLLALAATVMRLDHRACALAGFAAAAQYGTLVATAASGWDMNSADFHPYVYGLFSLGDQLVRIMLLMGMGIIGTVVNLRMRRPHILSAADSLTGLMNRRTFEERWAGEAARARRYGRPISVAAIDIDYFKQFNDTYGHAAGDLALRSVSRVIRNRVRAQDFVARIGGEEFVVALPETPAASAVDMAENLRKAVAAHAISIPATRTPVSVTISIGVASWPEHGEEISRLLERADNRLYEAKLAGRDQVKGPVAVSVEIPAAV